MLKYSISIKWSDEDNGFIAIVPELPGLSAFGETQEDVMAELKIAAKAYMDVLRQSGKPIPPPQKVIRYSGQIRLRMPKSLHARLADAAQKEGMSLNSYILCLLSQNYAQKATLPSNITKFQEKKNLKMVHE